MSKPKLSSPINDPVYYTLFKSPWGMTGIAATPKGLCQVVTRVKSEQSFTRYLRSVYLAEPIRNAAQLASYKKEFDLYFKGRLNRFQSPLDINVGTPFQKKVWSKLKTIPYGTTQSYQSLAKSIGNPKASRAVGSANGKNPLSIVIPCHRVINKNGGLGGYTGGLNIKKHLLKLENPDHAAI